MNEIQPMVITEQRSAGRPLMSMKLVSTPDDRERYSADHYDIEIDVDFDRIDAMEDFDEQRMGDWIKKGKEILLKILEGVAGGGGGGGDTIIVIKGDCNKCSF